VTDGVTVVVTDHAVERFRQRVGSGSVYVRDLVDRGVIFVCRHDHASRELLVVTLWEDARYGPPRVDQRFTDALKGDDAALVDPGRRWRERRDRG
jgi:hypothetical protein